jgi:hypothetical protein
MRLVQAMHGRMGMSHGTAGRFGPSPARRKASPQEKEISLKTVLSIAASAALLLSVTSASAVSLNPRGVGEVLLYPYYTVNAGQDTLLTVTNTSSVGKVVKIRFLEGYNGRPVLEVPLFLSANDVWAAAISQTADGSGAKLTTSDTSCTYTTAVPVAGQLFVDYAYTGQSTPPYNVADSGPQTLARTREGHIEIIADADIIPGSHTEDRIAHAPGGGAPAGCAQLTADLHTDLVAPTSGLMGSASIVNVGNGTFFAYTAEAITDFTDQAMGWGSGLTDTLADAHSSASSFDGGALAHVSFDSGDALTLDYADGIDAVSAVLMKDALYNDYLSVEALGAATDWVITFPTKRFYVDRLAYPANTQPLFDEPFTDGASTVFVGIDAYGREAEGEGASDCFDPPLPGCPEFLGYDVNVLSLYQTDVPGRVSSVLGSVLGNHLATGNDGGWMKLTLSASLNTLNRQLIGGQTAAGAGVTLNGLPATGFMVYNIINANAAPGKLANYGGSFVHRSTVSCASVGSTTTAPCVGVSGP